MIIAVCVGVLAFAVYLWQLSVPEFIAAYDSGVYLAASIHLVSGVIPYKDFAFVNPPGILLLMSPVAFLARVFGSHDGFILARIVTSFVTALNAGLLAWLVRYRGRIAMLIAGVGLGLLPVAMFVSSALKLDPFCICFVLIGSLVILSHDDHLGQISSRTLMIGGFLFGLGAVVKLWAFFPFLALAICLIPRCRRRAWIFVGAAGAGFVVPAAPFFLAAPRAFFSQVFTAQLIEKINPAMSPGVLSRLINLTGVSQTSISPTGAEAVVAFALLLLLVAFAYRLRMEHETADIFLLLAAILTAVGLLVAPAYQTYYGYFAAPFLVGVVAVTTARLGVPARKLRDRLQLSNSIRTFSSWASAVAGILMVFAMTLYVTSFYANYAWFAGFYGPYISVVSQVIPSGSCVVYEYVIFGVYSNRLQTSQPHCPKMVDPYGMWQSWGDHVIAPAPAFVAQWQRYFEAAQYVVLNYPSTSNVPWNRSLTRWFAENYHMVYGRNYIYIYENNSNS